MTVREDLTTAIWASLYDDDARCPGVSVADAQGAADAVLAWLGNLDPDCPPELVAAHLRADAGEIARLRATLKRYECGFCGG